MTEEKALQVQGDAAAVQAAQDYETLKAAVGKDLSNSQLKLAVAYAQSVGADLFARQIYPLVMDGRLQFLTSIDFLRVIAERSDKYAGQGKPEYEEDCDCQGEAMPFPFRHPVWAEVPIYRKGWDEPIVRRAYWHEYCPLEWDKDHRGQQVARGTWRKMPHVMLAKVSEAAGIRAAFPNDVKNLYTADEMEQAEAPVAIGELATSSGGGQASVAIPDDPDPPDWGKHEVRVRETPDGLRTVKTPDWYKDTEAKKIDKLEVKGKLGRRNVTVILLGDVALRAADHLELLEEGATLRTDGQQYEYEWQEGKPKALQLRNISRIAIATGGEWLEPEQGPADESLPLLDDESVLEGVAVEVDPTSGTTGRPDDSSDGPSSPPVSAATSTSSPNPEPVGKAASEGASSSSPEAGTSTDQTNAASGGTTPTNGDLRAQAAESFADLMPDADVDPGRGGNPTVGAGWEELPVMPAGESGAAVSLEGYYAKGEIVDVPGSEGKRMFDGWLTSQGMDKRIHVLMSEALAERSGVDRLGSGEEVYVRGTWRLPGGQPCILADTLRPA